MWPFNKSATSKPTTRVVIEIPDALDPTAADRKYVDPLRKLLADNDAGGIVDVSQGAPNTADEFSRIVTLELTELNVGLDIVGDFLVETEAPPGTLTQVCDADGNVVDRFMLMP